MLAHHAACDVTYLIAAVSSQPDATLQVELHLLKAPLDHRLVQACRHDVTSRYVTSCCVVVCLSINDVMNFSIG